MTFTRQPHAELFDERLEIVLDELELAIQWERPSIFVVLYDVDDTRADAETVLRNLLVERGQKVAHIQLDAETDGFIPLLRKMHAPEGQVYFIHGDASHCQTFAMIGSHRDIFTRKRIRAVLWLTQTAWRELAHSTPELWTYAKQVVALPDNPNSDHGLQHAVESTWLEADEANEENVTAAELDLRESMLLRDLAPQTQTTAERARLLLTLGILNWRKNNHEKAEELLQDALKAAIHIEDSWFEAECYNAIALVKFAQNKNDEAIEAYKRAIAIAPEQIFVWNNLGNLCLKIGRNDEAMLAFQKTLKHNPKDSVAWNGLGSVYFRIGYLEDSINAYRKAIECAPLLAQPWAGLGEAYAAAGRDLPAIAAYQKAIELNKHLIAPWRNLAELYQKQGRARDAVKTYQRALTVTPKNQQLWNELGLALLHSNAPAEAAAAFTQAIQLNQNFGAARSNLALAYARQGKYSEAIVSGKISLQVLTGDDEKIEAWDRLANCYRAVNDYEHAMLAYQTIDRLRGLTLPVENRAEDSSLAESCPAEESQPEESPAPEVREAHPAAPAWIIANESIATACDEALHWKHTQPRKEENPPMNHSLFAASAAPAVVVEVMLPADPLEHAEDINESRDPHVWNEKGNIHVQNKEYAKAIAAYNKAIELDRAFGWAYGNLAYVYLSMEKYPEALVLYQQSVKLLQSPGEKAGAWNSLGNIYRRLNEYENARQAYQHADELDPENAGRCASLDLARLQPNSRSVQVWMELGNLFFKSASYKEAINAYVNAVRVDPSSGWAHSNLAMALAFEGRYKEAVPVYLQSIALLPDDKDKAITWNRLGTVYRKLNDETNARKAHQTALILSNEKVNLLTRTRFSLLSNCLTN